MTFEPRRTGGKRATPSQGGPETTARRRGARTPATATSQWSVELTCISLMSCANIMLSIAILIEFSEEDTGKAQERDCQRAFCCDQSTGRWPWSGSLGCVDRMASAFAVVHGLLYLDTTMVTTLAPIIEESPQLQQPCEHFDPMEIDRRHRSDSRMIHQIGSFFLSCFRFSDP